MYNLLKKKSSGFSLVELIVIIAIIGILAAIVIASLSTARAKGRDAKRLNDLAQLQLALKLYSEANGEYPDCPSFFIFDTKEKGGSACDDETALQTLMQDFIGSDLADPKSSGQYRYIYDSAHQCTTLGTRKVLIAKRMEQAGNMNMENGPCDDNNGSFEADYGAQGRGNDNVEAHYIILE